MVSNHRILKIHFYSFERQTIRDRDRKTQLDHPADGSPSKSPQQGQGKVKDSKLGFNPQALLWW